MQRYETTFTLHRPPRWRVVRWLLIGLVLALLVAAASGWVYVTGSLPRHEGSVQLPGLTAPVTVERDGDGIPLIRARTEGDAYFALGYVHAQDRLFQMEMQRRVGAGRLSEIAGARTVPVDKLMRTLGHYRRAEAVFSRLSPDLRAAMAAYAAGVNAWIETRDRLLPPDMLLIGEPEPWKPADSLVWAELMAMTLSANWSTELMRARLAESLDEAQIDQLYPPTPDGAPITLDDRAGTVPAGDHRAASVLEPPSGASQAIASQAIASQAAASHGIASPAADPVSRAFAAAGLDPAAIGRLIGTTLLTAAPPALQPATASNSWVLSGAITETGRPILANDPHLRFQAPIMWYLARLEIGDGADRRTLAGATVPGVPVVVIGHNGRIAWGLTTTAADTQDLFIERIDPQNPSQYLAPGSPRLFETRNEWIRVAGSLWNPFAGDDLVSHTVRTTRHGPVVSDIDGDFADITDGGHVVALAWTGFDGPNMTAQAMFDVNHARNWDEFRAALINFHVPMQNVAYADVDGTIGIISPGRVPIRRQGDGRRPVPGWTDAFDWIGRVPYEDLPVAVNPPSGRLVNANNALVSDDYPHLITADWPYTGYRARRIAEMLDIGQAASQAAGLAGGTTGDGGPGPHTVDGSADLQLDTRSLFAADLLPLMTGITPTDPRLTEALAMLRGWDGAMRRTRPEPLIFATWWRELARHLYADELGEALFDAYTGWHTGFVKRALTDWPVWCDNVETDTRTETCADILAASLADAVSILTADYGEDLSGWSWGAAHQATFKHPMFGFIPFVRTLTDMALPSDGGMFTVNRGGTRLAGDRPVFRHGFGAGLRALFDLSDLDRSRFMIATGQSGNPMSPLYGNLVQRWRDGLYVTLQPRRGPTADGTQLPVLTLLPQQDG